MSKLASTDQPAPLHAAEALRTVGALGIAVDQLLGMSSIWTPARKWTPRTWTRVVLDHCPSLGFSATEPDGTKVGFVELAKGDHAALSKAAKGKVQIPVAKAVIPPGHDVKIAMQVRWKSGS
jgi:hypothetical protein